jgi:hypothetical protein
MALSERFGANDRRLGKSIAVGNDTAYIPSVVVVDAAGNEIAAGGTAVSASSGNVANASAVATLAAVAAKTNYITGLTITAAGATAAGVVTATITGLLGGTLSYTFAVPAGATLGATPLVLNFIPPHPASAVNTAIVATLPALGAGNTNAVVNVRGIQK